MPYVAPIPIRHDLIAAKIEGLSTYGTDSVPTAGSNSLRISKRGWNSITPRFEFPNLRDDVSNQSFIPIQAAFARGMSARLSIMWELKGLGATYTTSAFTDADPLFQACGWAGSFNAATWTYAPIISGSRPSCSIYVWTGGKQYKVSGCRGNFEAVIRPGRIIQVTFTLEGLLIAIETDVAVPTPTYSVAIPPPAISQACTIGPWTPDYDDITIRSGNSCGWLYTGQGAEGLHSYDYGISRPEVVVTGRSVPTSTYSPMQDWRDAVTRAFTCTWGVTTYNKGTFTDSGLWIPSEPTLDAQGPESGFTGWRVGYRCLAPSLLLN